MKLEYIKFLCRKLVDAADSYVRHEVESRLLIAFQQVNSKAAEEVGEAISCPITQRLRQQDQHLHTGD